MKTLPFKDLCSRLPYGVILQLTLWDKETTDCRLTGIDEDGNLTVDIPADCAFSIEDVKPYLRSLSSMTEDEKKEYHQIIVKSQECSFENGESATTMVNDWLLSKHFDVHGLIPKELALEALEGMY